MAGLPFAISTTKQRERGLQFYVATDEWQVEYARFINCRSSAYSSTHPSLVALSKNHLRGTWMPAADASVTIIYDRSSGGKDNAVLFVSLRSKIVEVHYISKMHFSWPQISSIPGFPARGSKAIFLSYKDSIGQIQKSALRFSAIDETEKFMNVVKKILEKGSPLHGLHQCRELNSEMSSVADAISSHIPLSKSNRDWEEQCIQSIDKSTQLRPLSSALESSQDSEPHVGLGDGVAANAEPFFPPSFTELMMNSYCPAVSEDPLPSPTIPFNASLADYLGVSTTTDSGDLETQFLRYLEKTSFKDLLASVEDVISQLGDDMLL